MTHESDLLIIGSGIAGLFGALKFAPHGRVTLLTKKQRADSSTNHAQGGIAAVLNTTDSVESHVADTLGSGAGICDEAVVRAVVTEGPARIRDLMDLGVRFTHRKDQPAEFDLGREGGHSQARVAHAADFTGRELERALLAAVEDHPNIRLLENHVAVNLITTRALGAADAPRCLGVYAYSAEVDEIETYVAPVTLLATGGVGKVYLYTSNPDIASGDGLAMAYRAGCRVANMEFIQFHPTCLYSPEAKNFLISEAVRGEGAVLRRPDGTAFMQDYDPRGDLATRDIVARAIDTEMKTLGADYMLLDITHMPAPDVMERFPNIYEFCLRFGFDMTKQPLPIVPAAHYSCGGVVTDLDGQTSLPGLLAGGEVAYTGLHGANRLASNSLLECVVIAHRAAQRAAALVRELPPVPEGVPRWQSGDVVDMDERVVITHNWDELRRCMWDYVGIVRSDRRLARAQARIRNLQEEINEYYWGARLTPDLIELRNLATVAECIVTCAQQRKESRGLHYTLDYPESDDANWKHPTYIQRELP